MRDAIGGVSSCLECTVLWLRDADIVVRSILEYNEMGRLKVTGTGVQLTVLTTTSLEHKALVFDNTTNSHHQ